MYERLNSDILLGPLAVLNHHRLFNTDREQNDPKRDYDHRWHRSYTVRHAV